MTTTRTRPAEVTLDGRLPERRYLPELHGVRGVALLAVVLFHLFGDGRVSGGIDIFLAISGFLFTGMLLREAAATGGRIDPFRYYGRLVRRILVPAVLVATATLLIGLLISPPTKHVQLWTEARASLLYFENFELIDSQLSYGAAGPDTSPFQHFWSLSVQGQFYIVWPAITIVAVLIAKRLEVSAVRVMGTIICAVLIVSLAAAIYVGRYDQDSAYLMTTTRAWQLAFGGLLALASGSIRLPRELRGLAGWLGLLLIVSCGFVLDGGELFPGPWALWPLLGFTLVLISAGPNGGNSDPIGSATHFLSNDILSWIGNHAYALYLWHWPLIIYYLEIGDRTTIDVRDSLAILAMTLALAVLTYRYVEQPMQRRNKQTGTAKEGNRNKGTVFIGGSLLVVSGTAISLFAPTAEIQASDHEVGEQFAQSDIYPGAEQYWLENQLPDVMPIPELASVGDYRPDYLWRDCGQRMGQAPGTDEIKVCEDISAPDDPIATVVLAGGSHAGHLEAAFQALGDKYGWEVLIVTKSSCVFGWEERPDQSMCGRWNQNFVAWLANNEVDLVVTPGSRLDRPEYILEAAPMWWQRISETGTDLVLVRGTPRHEANIPDCLAAGGTPQDCGPPKEPIADSNPLHDVSLGNNIYPIDLTEYVCPQIANNSVENCDAILGNVVVWYDQHHFSTLFSESLARAFEVELADLLPHLFD